MSETDFTQIEALLGRKPDRRKRYKIIDGQVCTIGSWTQSCSGCRETEDGHNVGSYDWDSKANCYLGSGCSECGYHGKVRVSMWLPEPGQPDRASP